MNEQSRIYAVFGMFCIALLLIVGGFAVVTHFQTAQAQTTTVTNTPLPIPCPLTYKGVKVYANNDTTPMIIYSIGSYFPATATAAVSQVITVEYKNKVNDTWTTAQIDATGLSLTKPTNL